MKLDSSIYSQAQRLARVPHFKYLLLGLACSAIVPTLYSKHYNLPHYTLEVLDKERELLPDKEQDVAQIRRENNYQVIDEENIYRLISSIMWTVSTDIYIFMCMHLYEFYVN